MMIVPSSILPSTSGTSYLALEDAVILQSNFLDDQTPVPYWVLTSHCIGWIPDIKVVNIQTKDYLGGSVPWKVSFGPKAKVIFSPL